MTKTKTETTVLHVTTEEQSASAMALLMSGAKTIAALIKLAEKAGKDDGEAQRNLPQLALNYGRLAAEGSAKADDAERIMSAYYAGKAGTVFGGETADSVSKSAKSKLKRFHDLGATAKTNAAGERIGEAFFKAYAGDVMLFRGGKSGYFERLYTAVKEQVSLLNDKGKFAVDESEMNLRVLEREEVASLFAPSAEPWTPVEAVERALKAVMLIRDGGGKAGNDPLRPAFGDTPYGDLSRIATRLGEILSLTKSAEGLNKLLGLRTLPAWSESDAAAAERKHRRGNLAEKLDAAEAKRNGRLVADKERRNREEQTLIPAKRDTLADTVEAIAPTVRNGSAMAHAMKAAAKAAKTAAKKQAAA